MTRKFMIPALIALICSAACSGADEAPENMPPEAFVADSIGEIVNRVRSSSRLYSSEYQVRKLVSYDDVRRLRGSVFGRRFDVRLPQGDRKVLVPVDAVIKGYIDFDGFSKANVKVDSGHVTVILPDPAVELTSTKIDHNNIKDHVSFTRMPFSQAELSEIEKHGRDVIVASIPQMGIVDDARRSAYDMIAPMLMSMGYAPEDITIEFRTHFTPEDYANKIIRLDSSLK